MFLLTAALCRRVPPGLGRRAALTEPLAVGLHAVNRAGVSPGESAIVVGCGPIGLALVTWLAAREVAPIVVADPSPGRRAHAAALGAHVVHDPATGPVVDAWADTGAVAPPVVFEAVGVPGVLDDIVHTMPARSRVVVTGVCMQPDTIRPLVAIVKEVSLQFVYAYDLDEFDATLRALDDGTLDGASLITGRVGLDGVGDAFTQLTRADEHVKVLVEPGGPPRLG